MSRRLVILLAIGLLGAVAVDFMSDATQTRPEKVDRSRRTALVLDVTSRHTADGRGPAEAAASLWQACQWTVQRSLEAPGVTAVSGDRYLLVVRPELGKKGLARLRGC